MPEDKSKQELTTMQVRLAALVDRLNTEYGDCYAKNNLTRRIIKGQLATLQLVDELLTYDDDKRSNVLEQIAAVRQDLKVMNESS